jgi:cobalamin transport system substrate-binding protein
MKRNYLVLLFLIIVVSALGLFYKARVTNRDSSVPVSQGTYKRIISLAPSITETLFALGLGDRVVGVSRFCRYPPAALEKKKVGGYLDPNYEAIVALQPDLVIVLPEHEEVREYLGKLDIRFLTVHNRKVSEIIETVKKIGSECGAGKQALILSDSIKSRVGSIEKEVESLDRPPVMVVVERTLGTGALKNLYVAGRNTFYDDLITYAGGGNVCESEQIAYPKISLEGLLNLNPGVVIDLIPDLRSKGLDESVVIRDWQSVSGIDAVGSDRVYVMSGDYIAIPGPRFIDLLENLARAIHPEVNWGSR